MDMPSHYLAYEGAHIALPPLDAIPEFTAGLIFGLTGDNHLDEIQHCMQVDQPLIDQAVSALDDFKHLHAISGLKHVGAIFWALPDAFDACSGMDDDIAAIQEWADIFHHPVRLTNEVSSNWLKHGSKIKKDIAKQQKDWHKGEWYKSGDKMADALVELVGPIRPKQTLEDFSQHLSMHLLH